MLRVNHRFPMEDHQTALEKDIAAAVADWFQDCMVKGPADGLDG